MSILKVDLKEQIVNINGLDIYIQRQAQDSRDDSVQFIVSRIYSLDSPVTAGNISRIAYIVYNKSENHLLLNTFIYSPPNEYIFNRANAVDKILSELSSQLKCPNIYLARKSVIKYWIKKLFNKSTKFYTEYDMIKLIANDY